MAALTDKQQRFCEEYLIDLNATQAAIRAGYSEKTAKQIGFENLTKSDIRAVIDEKLKALTLSADETVKLITDIAKGNVAEFFVVKEFLDTPTVEKHLSILIKETEDKISFENEFIKLAKITDKKKLKDHAAHQQKREEEIIRFKIELSRNPNATRWVPGEPIMSKRAELDVIKLVQAKEGNRIKSVKHSEYGLNIELYPADTALTNIARMHGLFEKDNQQAATVVNTALTQTVFKTKKHAPPIESENENEKN